MPSCHCRIAMWRDNRQQQVCLMLEQWGQANNVATFTLASEHEHCRAFCCETDMIDERPDDVITLPASFISDYEDDDEPTALLLS